MKFLLGLSHALNFLPKFPWKFQEIFRWNFLEDFEILCLEFSRFFLRLFLGNFRGIPRFAIFCPDPNKQGKPGPCDFFLRKFLGIAEISWKVPRKFRKKFPKWRRRSSKMFAPRVKVHLMDNTTEALTRPRIKSKWTYSQEDQRFSLFFHPRPPHMSRFAPTGPETETLTRPTPRHWYRRDRPPETTGTDETLNSHP